MRICNKTNNNSQSNKNLMRVTSWSLSRAYCGVQVDMQWKIKKEIKNYILVLHVHIKIPVYNQITMQCTVQRARPWLNHHRLVLISATPFDKLSKLLHQKYTFHFIKLGLVH